MGTVNLKVGMLYGLAREEMKKGVCSNFPKSLPLPGAVYTLLSSAFRVIGKGERTLEDKASVGTLYKAEASSTRVYAGFRILPFCLERPNVVVPP
ncbi:hypothetical protein CDAR_250131 [Caerostris darwini]|uniref:Uncharacterized protein n=1 Tax=Caerostris darwini TaxID=1538125 RepID=A0AAV4RBM4_9ARAC|nr:hypothetical protein CDAR_250131 [Caerostris darwini]